MGKRSYNMFCSLACALDIVGERWTLLIVRDLLTGPKRYKDLALTLQGMGPNLLSTRLKQLVDSKIIQKRRLPPPADVDVYELTDLGMQLENAVLALGQWGLQFLNYGGDAEQGFDPLWSTIMLRRLFKAEQAAELSLLYQFTIEETLFYVKIDHGELEIEQGSQPNPDLQIIMDKDHYAQFISLHLDIGEALSNGTLQLIGDKTLFNTFIELFAPTGLNLSEQQLQEQDAN